MESLPVGSFPCYIWFLLLWSEFDSLFFFMRMSMIDDTAVEPVVEAPVVEEETAVAAEEAAPVEEAPQA